MAACPIDVSKRGQSIAENCWDGLDVLGCAQTHHTYERKVSGVLCTDRKCAAKPEYNRQKDAISPHSMTWLARPMAPHAGPGLAPSRGYVTDMTVGILPD